MTPGCLDDVTAFRSSSIMVLYVIDERASSWNFLDRLIAI